MISDWSKIMQSNDAMKELIGIKLEEFNAICEITRKKIPRSHKYSNHSAKVKDFRIRVLITLLYIKNYGTQRFLAVLFSVTQSTICKIINQYLIILNNILDVDLKKKVMIPIQLIQITNVQTWNQKKKK